jgi:predicted MPP superfamily phosphohydrolase
VFQPRLPRFDYKHRAWNSALLRRRIGRTELSVGPLTIGLHGALHIREERLSIRDDACRLMYVSDVHLRRTRSDSLCRQVIEAARTCEIDVLLLGGDLVDGSTELGKLCDLVGALCEVAPLFAVGGNHDGHVGMNRVSEAVVSGGGQWIHAGAVRISHGSRVIAVSGPDAVTLPQGDFQVLCAHNPRVWKTARQRGYDLVLAGHLHGCQVVAFEYRDRLFPGAVFYPYCYLSHQHGSTRLVVSRGVSDLVPIRWRCPREVVLCHV